MERQSEDSLLDIQIKRNAFRKEGEQASVWSGGGSRLRRLSSCGRL